MAKAKTTLAFTRDIATSPEDLYFAFTTGMGLKEWFAQAADASTEKANYFHLYWEGGAQAAGQFHDLDENRALRWSWQGFKDPAPSEVHIRIEPTEEGSTLTVEHVLPAVDGEWAAVQASLEARWQKGLDTLKTVMETGRDPRVYEKPMLGIYVGDFVTPEMAARKGWPYNYGHKITGVIRDLGAAQAGLRKEDVILHIDGIKIKDYDALDQAIQAHKAGDLVEMDYLREGEVHTVRFALGNRPEPEIPPNAQALSETLSSFYKSANAQLQELIEGVTEEQAEYRPAPAEWSAKDVFAHLIVSERDMYSWVAGQALSDDRMPYTSNAPMRLKSIRTNLPDLKALFSGLQAAQNEGVTLLSELPSEFAARKSSFVPMATELLIGVPHHYRDHVDQISETLDAARAIG